MLNFLLRHYRLVDAYWFSKSRNNHGLKTSTKFKGAMWAKLAEVSASDILRYMGIEKDNLNNLIEVIEYFPWTIMANWTIKEISNERVLISANGLRGRNATTFFSIKDNMINAGAKYIDQTVVVDGNIVTSPNPHDLPDFCKAIIKLFKKNLT